MRRLSERLLPLLAAVVAGLVLVIGIRGFRAERPVAQRPGATAGTILVTEVSEPEPQMAPADDAGAALPAGNVAQALALFLEGKDPPPRSFRLAPGAWDITQAEGARALDEMAAVLKAHPQARVAVRGSDADAGRMIAALRARGVAAERLAPEPATGPAADKPAPTGPQQADASLEIMLLSR